MTTPPTQQCRVGKHGHCNHDIDPANGRPVCENRWPTFANAPVKPKLLPPKPSFPDCRRCASYRS